MTFSSTCRFGTTTGLGVVLSLTGALLVVYWPKIFDYVLNKQLVLTESSRSFELWAQPSIPMYSEFYFFNWTNPEDIRNLSTKPILVEIGPYVFREERQKTSLSWNNENATVTYKQNRAWYFEPSMSIGTMDDKIQTLNVPIVYGTLLAKTLPADLREMLNNIIDLNNMEISVIKTVGELSFDGYNDPLIDLVHMMPPETFPFKIPFDKFGYFVDRNNSDIYDGVFNMFTGQGDMSKFGSIGTWNYENPTSYYESYCGKANGSAGEIFPPKLKKTKISIFVAEICRTLQLNFKEEVKVGGVKGYRYWGDERTFVNQTASPANWCFCPSGECPPHGAIDISSCRWSAPLFISFPHFLYGDHSYRDAVIGMEPIESKHQLTVDLEPRTGIPLYANAAMQINVLIKPLPEFTLMKDVPKIYFPTLWMRQTAGLDEKTNSQLRWITRIPKIGTIVFFVILGIGILMLFVAVIYFWSVKVRGRDEKMIVVKD